MTSGGIYSTMYLWWWVRYGWNPGTCIYVRSMRVNQRGRKQENLCVRISLWRYHGEFFRSCVAWQFLYLVWCSMDHLRHDNTSEVQGWFQSGWEKDQARSFSGKWCFFLWLQEGYRVKSKVLASTPLLPPLSYTTWAHHKNSTSIHWNSCRSFPDCHQGPSREASHHW